MSEVVIIGAGVGGLAAAIDLAAQGFAVTVLESSDAPGGKAGVAVLDGVEVDTGPSLLTLPEVFESLFTAAGTTLADQVELLRPEPFFEYIFPDGLLLPIHHDLEATFESVRATLGAEAADQLRRFLGYAAEIWESAAPSFILGDAPTLGTLVRLGLSRLRSLMRLDAMRTMHGAIAAHVTEPHLAALLLRYATYVGSDPHAAPATLNCVAWVELGLGAWGVRGGIQSLVGALVRCALRLGVRFSFGEPVRRIERVRGRVSGVSTDRRTLATSHVIANADVAHVAGPLLGGERSLDRSHLPRSMSGYNAVFRAARRSDRAAHTVVFPERYEEEFADIFQRGRPPIDPTVYLCAQEVCHRRIGWRDHEPLFVMANAPAEPPEGARDPAEWSALALAVRTRLLRAGAITAEDRAVWERTPAELARAFPDTGGAIYGAASHGAFTVLSRPGNRAASVPGLYLASGSVHPGGGLPLALLSGRAAARALIEDAGAAGRRSA